MVTQEDLTRIRSIVEKAYPYHFGNQERELTLEPHVDHYGYDVVDVVFVFEEPPDLNGRLIVDFEGQVNDAMSEEDILIDTGFHYHLRAELEAIMAEDERE